MKTSKKSVGLAALTLSLATGCTSEVPQESSQIAEQAKTDVAAHADLFDANGEIVASVIVQTNTDNAKIAVTANGLSATEHGLHFHEVGACEGPDFKSAGGHLNPLGKSHGSKSDDGSHFGDLPNLVPDQSGAASLEITLTRSANDVEGWLFDDDGTAVVIHQSADDYKSQPSGNAGPRLACGVLRSAS